MVRESRALQGIRYVLGVLVLSVASVGVVRAVFAVEWNEPSANPPGANPPGFVWTQSPEGEPQPGGQFHVAGDGKVGGLFTAAKVVADELCIGAADCRSEWPGGTITGVKGAGNITGGGVEGAVSLRLVDSPVIPGNLAVRGCLGPVFLGPSVASWKGDVGGYLQANQKCAAGRHVCTTVEILNSINCGVFDDIGTPNGTEMWIANLAPSLPTPTNDCIGWTTASGDWRGIKWKIQANGGAAYGESCAIEHPFACCG